MQRVGATDCNLLINVTIEEFESDLKSNLYKIWNRMSKQPLDIELQNPIILPATLARDAYGIKSRRSPRLCTTILFLPRFSHQPGSASCSPCDRPNRRAVQIDVLFAIQSHPKLPSKPEAFFAHLI